MTFLKSLTQQKRFSFLVLIVSLLLLALVSGYHVRRAMVRVDVYGSIADPATLATIQSIQLVQQYLPGRIKLRVHPVMRPSGETLESYVLKTQDASQLSEMTEEELTETMRFRTLLRLHFATAVTYLETRYRTELTAQDIISRTNIPRWLLAITTTQERSRLERDSQRFAELIQQYQLTDFPVPQLFLNDELYRGPGDPQALAVRIARSILRRGADELPAPRRVALWGGRISFALSRPYRLHGFPEANSAADCDDQPDKTGVLVDPQTPYQRCRYQNPVPVTVSVYGALPTEQQQLLDDMRQDIKGLATETIADTKQKEQLRQAIAALKLPEQFRDLTREPYIVFATAVTQDPAGASYYESGLFIPLPDGRFLFNTVPFKNSAKK